MSMMDDDTSVMKDMKQGDPFPSNDVILNNEGFTTGFVDRPTLSTSDSDILVRLSDLVLEISNIGECSKRVFRTEASNLTRRVKLLSPLFEEVKEHHGGGSSLPILPNEADRQLRLIERALQAARDLLKSCQSGSKLYMVCCHCYRQIIIEMLIWSLYCIYAVVCIIAVYSGRVISFGLKEGMDISQNPL